MTTYDAIKNALETLKTPRSAWAKGVRAYAQDLLENLNPAEEYNREMLHKALLNWAEDWEMYSNGGCALVYNSDIAERLCTPSELRKTENGYKDPNRYESWIDVQTRALYQAERIINTAAAKAA